MHTHTAIDRAFARVLSFASSFSHLTFTFVFCFFRAKEQVSCRYGQLAFRYSGEEERERRRVENILTLRELCFWKEGKRESVCRWY